MVDWVTGLLILVIDCVPDAVLPATLVLEFLVFGLTVAIYLARLAVDGLCVLCCNDWVPVCEVLMDWWELRTFWLMLDVGCGCCCRPCAEVTEDKEMVGTMFIWRESFCGLPFY